MHWLFCNKHRVSSKVCQFCGLLLCSDSMPAVICFLPVVIYALLRYAVLLGIISALYNLVDTKYSQANCDLCNAVMQAETLGTLWAAH